MRVFLVVVKCYAENDVRAYAPDFPGCVCTAESKDSALHLLKKCLSVHVKALQSAGYTIPQPSSEDAVREVIRHDNTQSQIEAIEIDDGGASRQWSTRDAARILNLTKASVNNMVKRGDLKAEKIGNMNVIAESSLVEAYSISRHMK